MMKIKKFAQAASVAALTLGVAFVATPAQKASAQIVGAGASSVTTVFDDNNPLSDTARGYDSAVFDYAARQFDTPYRYIVTGSGAGRNAFLNGTTVTNATTNYTFTGPNRDSNTPRSVSIGGRVNFVATDGLGTSFGTGAFVRNNTIINPSTNAPVNDPVTNQRYIVVNEANLNVVFPYNVPTVPTNPNSPQFDVTISGETACRILRGNTSLGDPVNWSQVVNTSSVRGPNLPIRRVGRGDVSGTTATLQGPTAPTATNFGFLQACNGFTSGGTTVPPIATTFSGTGAIPAVVPTGTVTGFNDGTLIPNRRNTPAVPANATDIIVNAASPSGNAPADPFGAAASGDDNNSTTLQVGSNPTFSGSYTLGVINAVRNSPGAIGYTESAAAARGQLLSGAPLPIATRVDAQAPAPGIQTLAVGPTYVIFHATYPDAATINAAQDVCYGAVFSGFLSNNSPSNYPKQAGFNINTAGGQFPYSPAGSTEQGTDTDNYGPLTLNPFDFGPCTRIGGAAPFIPNP